MDIPMNVCRDIENSKDEYAMAVWMPPKNISRKA